MSVLPVTYYVMKCDGCGTDADYGDFSAMSDANQAVEYADDGWIEVRDKHFCNDCTVWSEDEDCFVPAPQNAAEVRSTDTTDERPATCCGACPPLNRGGFDCTCAGNPNCRLTNERGE